MVLDGGIARFERHIFGRSAWPITFPYRESERQVSVGSHVSSPTVLRSPRDRRPKFPQMDPTPPSLISATAEPLWSAPYRSIRRANVCGSSTTRSSRNSPVSSGRSDAFTLMGCGIRRTWARRGWRHCSHTWPLGAMSRRLCCCTWPIGPPAAERGCGAAGRRARRPGSVAWVAARPPPHPSPEGRGAIQALPRGDEEQQSLHRVATEVRATPARAAARRAWPPAPPPLTLPPHAARRRTCQRSHRQPVVAVRRADAAARAGPGR